MTRIVTFNIQFGIGRDGRADLGRVIAALRGADIACLQEVEKGWRRDGDIDQPAVIADAFPGYWYVFAPGLDVHWSPPAGEAHRPGFRRQHGEMVLSRHPILDTRTWMLPRRPTTVFSQHRLLLETVIACPEGPLRLYTTHLCHLGVDTRLPQVRAIVERIADHATGPTWTGTHFPEAGWDNGEVQPPWPEDFVFCGDLNCLPGSVEYATFAAEWADAAAALGHDPQAPTFIMPDSPPRRLDYFFLSRGLVPWLRSYAVDADCIASDHVPVAIEIGE